MKKFLSFLLVLCTVTPSWAVTKTLLDTTTAQDAAAKSFDTTVDNVKKYSSFATAISTIAGQTRTLIIPDSQTVSANVSIPATLTLQFTGAGQLSIATGVTVTIVGPITAQVRQIFALTGTGIVSLAGNTAVKEVYPQWWGCTADGSNDCTVPIQQAINAVNSAGGGTVYFTRGSYAINTIHDEIGGKHVGVVMKGNVTLEGVGDSSIITTSNNNAGIAWNVIQFITIGKDHPSFDTSLTFYTISAGTASKGNSTLTLATPAQAGNFVVNDYIYVKTGQTIDPGTTEPDAEINRVVSADAGSGVITFKWPLAKTYVQEYYVAGVAGRTTPTPTANLATYGVANITDRIQENMAIRKLRFQTSQVTPQFLVGGSFVGLKVENCSADAYNNFYSMGDYRGGLFRGNRIHLRTHGAAWWSAVKGTTDAIATDNELSSDDIGNVQVHEGAAQVHVSGNSMLNGSGGAAVNVISLRGRGYDIFVQNNLIVNAGGASGGINASYSEYNPPDTDLIITGNILSGNAGKVAVTVNNAYVINNHSGSGTGNVQIFDGQQVVGVQACSARIITTDANNFPTVTLCRVPLGSYITNAFLHVLQGFDATGTDFISIGDDAANTSIITATDVSTAGVKVVTLGAKVGLRISDLTVKAYYTNTLVAPTQGRAVMIIEFYPASRAQ